MSPNRVAPVLGGLLVLALVAVAGFTLMPDSDDPIPLVEAPTAAAAAPAGPWVDRPGVSANRCGVVVYTPPRASQAHEADLCRPGPTARGAVILIHGGGGYSGDRSTMQEWAGWYRAQEFVTLSIDYTLLGDGLPEPTYPRPEQDLKAAIQWTRLQAERLGFDPQAILLHGSSAGARLAAQAFVTPDDPWFSSPDLYRGVPQHAAGLIGFYGYYDGDTLEAERYYGGLPRTGDTAVNLRWRKANSVSQAANATGPVLLFHGDVDGLITVAQTERFGSALAESGIDVTAYIVTDGDHAFDGRYGDLTTDTGRDAAAEIEAWLAERFPG